MVIRKYTNISVNLAIFGIIVSQNLFTLLKDRQIYFKYSVLDLDVLLIVHPSIILAINHLIQKSFFIISLLYASTCFEHYALIIRRSKLYYTASGIITSVHGTATYRCDDTRCCVIQF